MPRISQASEPRTGWGIYRASYVPQVRQVCWYKAGTLHDTTLAKHAVPGTLVALFLSPRNETTRDLDSSLCRLEHGNSIADKAWLLGNTRSLLVGTEIRCTTGLSQQASWSLSSILLYSGPSEVVALHNHHSFSSESGLWRIAIPNFLLISPSRKRTNADTNNSCDVFTCPHEPRHQSQYQ